MRALSDPVKFLATRRNVKGKLKGVWADSMPWNSNRMQEQLLKLYKIQVTIG